MDYKIPDEKKKKVFENKSVTAVNTRTVSRRAFKTTEEFETPPELKNKMNKMKHKASIDEIEFD